MHYIFQKEKKIFSTSSEIFKQESIIIHISLTIIRHVYFYTFFVKYFQIATFISLFKYCLNRTNLKIIDQFMARKKSFVSFGVWKIPQPRDAWLDFIFLNNYNSVVNNILYFLYLMEEQWPKRIRFHNFQQTFRPETSTSSII